MSLANKKPLETGAGASSENMDPKSIIGGGTTGKGLAISVRDTVGDVLLADGTSDFLPREDGVNVLDFIPRINPDAVLAKIRANTTSMPKTLPKAKKGASTQDPISL